MKRPPKNGVKITKDTAKEMQEKSVEARKKKKTLKDIDYGAFESFERLKEIQDLAFETGNITAALKAEELKGKLLGLYVEKTAQTDSEGNDIPEPLVFKIQPVEVIHKDERIKDNKENNFSSDDQGKI